MRKMNGRAWFSLVVFFGILVGSFAMVCRAQSQLGEKDFPYWATFLFGFFPTMFFGFLVWYWARQTGRKDVPTR